MNNLIKDLFKKRDGIYAIQLFSNKCLTLEDFDESHLIFRMEINKLWKSKPILFRADPFLLLHNDELYLFYELQRGFDHGEIYMMKTTDLKHWSEPIVVLKEPFHLSFPFVFEYKGDVYMIPESEEANQVRLYKGNKDLTSFEFCRVLIEQEREEGINCNYVDSHLYRKNEKIYLFTSYMKNWEMKQEIYVTDDLLHGVFERHVCSPICTSHEFGRNGGSIINIKEKIFRVSQDCHKVYGENVSLHEITDINDTVYKEKLYKRNIYSHNKLFPDGGHHLNILLYKGQYIYATDYKQNKWTWFHLYQSFYKSLKQRLLF